MRPVCMALNHFDDVGRIRLNSVYGETVGPKGNLSQEFACAKSCWGFADAVPDDSEQGTQFGGAGRFSER